MRCLSLARKLKFHGASITFLCRPWGDALISKIDPEFKVILLDRLEQNERSKSKKESNHSEWLGCSEDRDAEDSLKALSVNGYHKIDLLIVDNYGVSEIWEKKMQTAQIY